MLNWILRLVLCGEGGGCVIKTSERIILTVAWANFLLGIAGLLKFVPLGLVAVQSTMSANSGVAWRWSIDLVSDSHWIFLVWFAVLLTLRFASNRLLIFPWTYDAIAP